MSRTFSMPELAESVVEGEIVQWLAEEGDVVALDQPLLEVMTDKVTVEIPSPFGGVLVERLAAEGETVPVGAPIARFDAAPDEQAGTGDGATRTSAPEPASGTSPPAGGEARREPDRASDDAEGTDDGDALTLFKAGGPSHDGPLPTVRKPVRTPARETARPSQPPAAAEPEPGRPRGPWGRPLAVPAARKRARELGIPLEQVLGSGPHGRIRIEDVEAQRASGRSASVQAGAGPAPLGSYVSSPLAPPPDAPETTRVPLRGVRRTIANQLLEGHLSTVPTLAVEEADVSKLVALRTRLKDRAADRGVKLTYLPFVLKALTRSLAAFPAMNARWDEDAGEIVRFRDAHLGVAVDTDQGLIVPVIRDASRRALLDLGAEAARLAEAARARRLTPEELRGGTFSVTNIGSVGALLSMPVLNAPEAGILGVHRIRKRPVALDDDSIVARPMLYLSLTFDHRLIDGAEATRFLVHVVRGLEEPEPMLLGETGLEDVLLDA